MTKEPFLSSLDKGSSRFLSEVVEQSLRNGRRTPADFIRHFPPGVMMMALADAPDLRAKFLTLLVGLREKTALRTPAEDAGRLLQSALEEGDCDAEAIVSVFVPDERVRYLPAPPLWSFLIEDEFWKVSRAKDPQGHKSAQAHIAYMVERSIAHALRSHTDIVEGITIETLADKLPRAEMAKAIRGALQLGRNKTPYTESDLYAAVPATVLVDHIPLPTIMEQVIVALARKAAFIEEVATAAATAAAAPIPHVSDAPPSYDDLQPPSFSDAVLTD